ncbi:hypothetical protein A2715_05215 [Candidatus Woesebacteria bacterium RIFCSPHIGHO2_01_FULL_39_32]|uniref:Response regulatory domain-containing protein n=1 Tax=Candidatus Woesebacteria bacterium RIFCSPLOWO2_01_FULL_39_25 TaxID=1802521 RepID=A0A1F8BMQ5_9BACT|nr:MAG: hypothetical protein A2124_01355 [Candidatus Woesebacteria bacterium GWB1_37_5]OGM25418.1 MAG: hypothetical protein A2715_05215 [Candidatus Woesebacteria bacterium RIFCSPHIGHO2_01_FULL_39_32]OGM38523.1 MAG: hypothetical protein A3F01_04175 [Candidatus Woesebacteria bacterium RIFCSPHIGHO2_12_FULL_38_11]OGM64949.1 MAG: hypothetical protein A2893_04825 [Candidatus Woesebacteria bacterium RIFCSPLOWO2_01_FULL_39_25]
MSQKKILIVEDDIQTQRVYHNKLTSEGYAVVLAATGKEGVFTAKKIRPDLVILDIMLPGTGMNGFDVLENMKKDQELKNIPVLVLTNLDTEERVAKEIGANEYLVKANVSIDEVAERVNKRLQK